MEYVPSSIDVYDLDFRTSTYGEITGNSSLVKPSPPHSKALLCLSSFTICRCAKVNIITNPFQVCSITDEIIPLQSGSVFYECAKLTGMLYKHRFIFTMDGNIKLCIDRIPYVSNFTKSPFSLILQI